MYVLNLGLKMHNNANKKLYAIDFLVYFSIPTLLLIRSAPFTLELTLYIIRMYPAALKMNIVGFYLAEPSQASS